MDTSYQSLSRAELQRLHTSLYGHQTSLRGTKSVARAVTLKAAATRRLATSSAQSRPQSAPSREPRLPTTVGCTSGSTTRVSEPCLKSRLSHSNLSRDVWLRLTSAETKSTLVKELHQWICTIAPNEVSPPWSLMNARARYLLHADDEDAAQRWISICAKSESMALVRCRVCLGPPATGVRSSSTRPKSCWCGDSNTTKKASHGQAGLQHEDDGPTSDHTRRSRISAAVAHAKLNRLLDQGGSYFGQVCRGTGTTADEVAAQVLGQYIIPDESLIRELARLSQREKKKRCLIASLTGNSDAGCGDAATHGSEADVVDDEATKSDDAGAFDAETEREIEAYMDTRSREPDDLVQFPMIDVQLQMDSKLLSIKVHMSDAQVRFLLRHAKENDTGSRSTFAFVTEAMCIDVDVWFGVTGLWKGKRIWIVRDPTEHCIVDSIIVDSMVWMKRRIDEGAQSTDPFVCTVCGNVRASGNGVYAKLNGRDVQRGSYRCLICGKDQIHVSAVGGLHRARPRWNSTIGRPLSKVERIELEFGDLHSGTPKRIGGLGSHKL